MTAFTAVFIPGDHFMSENLNNTPNYQNLQKVGDDIVILNGKVLGHAWHTWCKNGTNGKRMSCMVPMERGWVALTYMPHANIPSSNPKSNDFRTMGLWIWITFFWYALYRLDRGPVYPKSYSIYPDHFEHILNLEEVMRKVCVLYYGPPCIHQTRRDNRP